MKHARLSFVDRSWFTPSQSSCTLSSLPLISARLKRDGSTTVASNFCADAI